MRSISIGRIEVNGNGGKLVRSTPRKQIDKYSAGGVDTGSAVFSGFSARSARVEIGEESRGKKESLDDEQVGRD